VFLSGLGLWLGSIFKRVGTAVPLTVVAAVVLWVLIPAYLPHVPEIAGFGDSPDCYIRNASTPPMLVTLNPAGQAMVFAPAAVRLASGRGLNYAFPDEWRPIGAGVFTQRMAITTACYVALGALLVRLTVRRMRRNIFR